MRGRGENANKFTASNHAYVRVPVGGRPEVLGPHKEGPLAPPGAADQGQRDADVPPLVRRCLLVCLLRHGQYAAHVGRRIATFEIDATECLAAHAEGGAHADHQRGHALGGHGGVRMALVGGRIDDVLDDRAVRAAVEEQDVGAVEHGQRPQDDGGAPAEPHARRRVRRGDVFLDALVAPPETPLFP